MTRKQLLAKIRKCLAMSASANEHEAAAALARARALMEEYEVDQAEVDLAEVSESDARTSRCQRMPRWEAILGSTVERALGVSSFITGEGDFRFIGRGAHAEIAAYSFAVLHRQLRRARATYIKAKLRRCRPGRQRERANIYCEGWAAAVFAKIAQLAPPAAEDELIGKYLATRYPGLVELTPRAGRAGKGTARSAAASDYFRGVMAGEEVELRAGVAGGKQALLA